jgi:hypothetical protein
MPDRTTVERESNELRREIGSLEQQLRSLRDYIATQERLLRNAAESVRNITERSLAEARGDLHLKELRLQQLKQDLQRNQVYLDKLAQIERKQNDVETLERELQRITSMLDRSRIELAQLNQDYGRLSGPAPEYALVFEGGQRVSLSTDGRDLLVGCADSNVFPDVDLTPFGGTSSGVSRRHATLRYGSGGWTITDLGSTNGTFVNTTRLQPNSATPVADGARLRFGGVDATFSGQQPVANKTVLLN